VIGVVVSTTSGEIVVGSKSQRRVARARRALPP
jgi:hypothetical protein